MKKADKAQVAERVECFTVQVDGKLYGPFPKKDKRKFNYLNGRSGVEIKPVWLDKASLSSLPRARVRGGASWGGRQNKAEPLAASAACDSLEGK